MTRSDWIEADPGWLARRLLPWQKRVGRNDLPWQRRPADPYLVWVSEVMLQQTQVATALQRFPPFVARFPDLRSLAAASEAEVLARWSGLGYYQRARRLHAAARQLWEGGGALPDTVEGWTRLPGVGRSTAGAVLSLGMGRRAPVLDANVRRVLGRLCAPASGAEFWRLAERFLPQKGCAGHNQGLMDLGALLCLPRAPKCGECPLRQGCPVGTGEVPWDMARSSAGPRSRGAARRVERLCWLAARTPEGWLLERRDAAGVWPSLWTPVQGADLQDCLRRLRRHGLRPAPPRNLGAQSWQLTHKRLQLELFACRAEFADARLADGDGLALVSGAQDLERLGMPSPARRWQLELMEGAPAPD